jgi:hypothetical protein
MVKNKPKRANRSRSIKKHAMADSFAEGCDVLARNVQRFKRNVKIKFAER